MRHLITFMLLVIAACGGKVDEPRSETSAPTATSTVGGPASPSPTPTGHIVSTEDGCTHACKRMATCAPEAKDDYCVSSCHQTLGNGDADQANFARCIDRLTCEDIRRSLSMDFGPIGECYEKVFNG